MCLDALDDAGGGAHGFEPIRLDARLRRTRTKSSACRRPGFLMRKFQPSDALRRLSRRSDRPCPAGAQLRKTRLARGAVCRIAGHQFFLVMTPFGSPPSLSAQVAFPEGCDPHRDGAPGSGFDLTSNRLTATALSPLVSASLCVSLIRWDLLTPSVWAAGRGGPRRFPACGSSSVEDGSSGRNVSRASIQTSWLAGSIAGRTRPPASSPSAGSNLHHISPSPRVLGEAALQRLSRTTGTPNAWLARQHSTAATRGAGCRRA